MGVNGSSFGPTQKRHAIIISSAVQIVTVTHTMRSSSSAHAYPGSNPNCPVIGT
jgi:hypothetical protein